MTTVTAWNPVDSDDEFENSEESRGTGREALLVIIDSSLDMFRPWQDETPFKAAIKSCHSMWRSKIISSPKDLVGILLMGTEKEKNSSNFPNLYVLQDMANVTVNSIVQLEKMQNSDDHDGFCDKIGNSSDYNLKDMFWLAKILFEEAKTTTFSKKIVFFTCEDNPHGGEASLRNDAVRKFKDLGNIDFSIISFNNDFDYDKFYGSILEDQTSISIPTDLDSLVKVVRLKQRLKRALTRSTLELAPGIKIGVGIYSLIRRALPPKAVKINQRNNEVVTKTVNKFRADTGATILKSEEVSIVAVQGEQVVFKPEELKSAKYIYQSGIELLGFLDRSEVDIFGWFHSDGYFLYPDEDRFNGSKDLFVALLRRCNELKKVAIVKMVITRGRTPRLGCLIPTVKEEVGRNQKLPQGFQLFKLPFADEIRQMNFDWAHEPTPELVEMMAAIIKKITNKKFDVLDVQNPALQNRWREIEAAVLDDDGATLSLDTFVDYTLPNLSGMGDRIGDLSRDVMEKSAELNQKIRERSGPAAKKPKVNVNMAMEAKHKRVEKLTCDILKDFLEGVGVPTQRKVKAQLVSAVYDHFAKN